MAASLDWERRIARWCGKTVHMAHLVAVDAADGEVIAVVPCIVPSKPNGASSTGVSGPTAQMLSYN